MYVFQSKKNISEATSEDICSSSEENEDDLDDQISSNDEDSDFDPTVQTDVDADYYVDVLDEENLRQLNMND